jgi:branched-subunit amino acid transport protein
MSLWVVIFLAGLATFLTRLSFIWLAGRREMPGWLRRGLRFVPPAVLTAIIFPEVFIRDGVLALSPLENVRIIAAAVAALVAWRTRNILLTLAAGMLVLWLSQVVL